MKALAILLADVVDRADVGMIQGGGGLRLPLKAAQGLRILGRHRRAGTSGLQSDRAGCPRPCRPHPCRHRRASRRRDSARWFGRSSTKEQWRLILGGQRGQVNAPDSGTGALAQEIFVLINLTLGYNAIRDGREQGSKSPGTQERRGPAGKSGARRNSSARCRNGASSAADRRAPKQNRRRVSRQ